MDTSTSLGQLVSEIRRHTTWRDKRVRALRPWAEDDTRFFAAVTRLLRMLRAHGLIKKITHTHRCTLTDKGRQIFPAILTANRLTLGQLQTAAS